MAVFLLLGFFIVLRQDSQDLMDFVYFITFLMKVMKHNPPCMAENHGFVAGTFRFPILLPSLCLCLTTALPSKRD